jgi:hypothetical protein
MPSPLGHSSNHRGRRQLGPGRLPGRPFGAAAAQVSSRARAGTICNGKRVLHGDRLSRSLSSSYFGSTTTARNGSSPSLEVETR